MLKKLIKFISCRLPEVRRTARRRRFKRGTPNYASDVQYPAIYASSGRPKWQAGWKFRRCSCGKFTFGLTRRGRIAATAKRGAGAGTELFAACALTWNLKHLFLNQ